MFHFIFRYHKWICNIFQTIPFTIGWNCRPTPWHSNQQIQMLQREIIFNSIRTQEKIFINIHIFLLIIILFFLLKAEKLLSMVKWDQVCNNSAVFSQIFATNVLGSRAAEFQAKVCASVSFQEFFNRPWMETLSKIHGFERYITLVSFQSSHIFLIIFLSLKFISQTFYIDN